MVRPAEMILQVSQRPYSFSLQDDPENLFRSLSVFQVIDYTIEGLRKLLDRAVADVRQNLVPVLSLIQFNECLKRFQV